MKRFPIKIDLTDFCADERKLVILLVDPKWETVEGLQRRVGTMFDVPVVKFQTDDGYYIPSQESIELIKCLTKIKAFLPKPLLSKKQKASILSNCKAVCKSTQQENFCLASKLFATESPLMPVKSQKKRKSSPVATDLCISISNQPKRSKNAYVQVETVKKDTTEVTSTSQKSAINIQNTDHKQGVGNTTNDMLTKNKLVKPTESYSSIFNEKLSQNNSTLDTAEETIVSDRAIIEDDSQSIKPAAFNCELEDLTMTKPRLFKLKTPIKINEQIILAKAPFGNNNMSYCSVIGSKTIFEPQLSITGQFTQSIKTSNASSKTKTETRLSEENTNYDACNNNGMISEQTHEELRDVNTDLYESTGDEESCIIELNDTEDVMLAD